MKLPNFRLYDTQALFGAVLAILALLVLPVLLVLIFKNFDTQQNVIWINPGSKGFGKYREPLVLVASAVIVLLGAIGGILGFNSLGQKRNNRQGLSWIGLAFGALSIVLAALSLVAWMQLKLPIVAG